MSKILILPELSFGEREISAAMDFKAKYSLKEQSSTSALDSLKDFDWSTVVVVSTSSVATVDIPLFQLCLKVQDTDGNDRDIVLEMTTEELRGWLLELTPTQTAVLEKA